MTKKIGILGGTFNPIHNGHLHIANCAKEALKLDLVLLQPNKLPYYKSTLRTTDTDRMNMVKLAISGCEDLRASSFELDFSDYTSSYDTLKLMQEQNPEDCFVMIIGMDSFLYLDKWINGSLIPEIANIAVLTRPGFTLDLNNISPELRLIYQKHIQKNYEITAKHGQLFMINCKPMAISATELRAELRNNNINKTKDLLNPRVQEYIDNHNLYVGNEFLDK